jgi:predicted kinase
MKVYIMRGPSGSGKSTWVKHNVPKAFIVSCDNFFMVKGVYKSDPSRLQEFHDRCLLDFLNALDRRVPEIVVDNTNLRIFQIAPYYRLAEVFHYDVEIIWITALAEVCKNRNNHGVSASVIDQQFATMEPLPPWCHVRLI